MSGMLGRVCVLGVVAAVAGCVETTGAGDGLSETEARFLQMEQPCIAQAARLTGVSRGAIFVRERIRTGGGPLLVLDAGGTAYSCRLEGDGGVTVFSEFAN